MKANLFVLFLFLAAATRTTLSAAISSAPQQNADNLRLGTQVKAAEGIRILNGRTRRSPDGFDVNETAKLSKEKSSNVEDTVTNTKIVEVMAPTVDFITKILKQFDVNLDLN